MLPASLLVPSPCQGWLGHWGSLLNRCVETCDDESLIFMLTVVKTMMVPYNIAPKSTAPHIHYGQQKAPQICQHALVFAVVPKLAATVSLALQTPL